MVIECWPGETSVLVGEQFPTVNPRRPSRWVRFWIPIVQTLCWQNMVATLSPVSNPFPVEMTYGE